MSPSPKRYKHLRRYLRKKNDSQELERVLRQNIRRARMFADRFYRSRQPGPSDPDPWPTWEELFSLALEAIWWAVRKFRGKDVRRFNSFINATTQEIIRRNVTNAKIRHSTQAQILSEEAERVWREKTTVFTVKRHGRWIQDRTLCAPSAEEEVMREEARRRFRELVEQLPEEEKKRLLVLLGWEEGKGVRKGEEGAFLERVREKLRAMVTEEEWEWLRRWLLE